MTKRLPLPKFDASLMGAHRLSVLTDNDLFQTCGVRIAFTGREGGVSEGAFAALNCGNHVGDDPFAVKRNREIVLEALEHKTDCSLIVPSQVHGTNIIEVEQFEFANQASKLAAEGADGIIVRTSSVAALLNFADCLSLILVTPSGEFAVVHAGWRGAIAGIAAKAAKMLAASDDARSQLNAYIGPFIHAECFEMSTEIANRFAEEFGTHVLTDARHVDLFQVVKSNLVETGLDPTRIIEAGICTRCNSDRYFSYRATGGKCGRHCAVALRI